MTVLVAPDSFKGTYPAAEVAAAIAAGIRDAGGTAAELPVADGGEGTFDALCSSLQASAVSVVAQNPWGEPLAATIGLAADGTAVVELAQASGLTVPSSGPRDAVSASTYGTGMMVSAAVDAGATHIMVAAGGSATTDGGAGAVQAINDGGGLRGARLTVLSDVTSTFLERVRRSGRTIPVVAVVGSVAADLGAYARNFSDILVASDAAAMHAAGMSVAGYSAARL